MQVFNTESTQENVAVQLRPRQSMSRYLVYYFRHKPLGTIGIALVAVMVFTAVFAPLIANYTFQEQNYDALKESPSTSHFFGTDQFGRDVFSRVVHGARISMMVGLFAVVAGTGAGAIVGLVSGFFMGPAITSPKAPAWTWAGARAWGGTASPRFTILVMLHQPASKYHTVFWSCAGGVWPKGNLTFREGTVQSTPITYR